MIEYNSITKSLEECNLHAEKAYWCAARIDTQAAQSLGIADKVIGILHLLQMVDDKTFELINTINKQQQ